MPFCSKCGSAVEGRFCAKCGAPMDGAPGRAGPAPSYSPPPPGTAAGAGMDDNVAGALCYLVGFITGILFLVLAPYNQNRTIRFHAFQSIFLNIAWFAVYIVAKIISYAFLAIPILGVFVSVVLLLAVSLAGVIIWFYLMFKTYNGE